MVREKLQELEEIRGGEGRSYLGILITPVHTVVTLLLSDDLAGILNNDLLRIESAVCADTVAAVESFAYLNPDAILTTSFCSLAERFEGTVSAVLGADVAIAIITLVEHRAVVASFIASRIGLAVAFGEFLGLGLLP